MSPVRILIADDSAVIRQLYREVLAADGDIEIVAEAADGDAAIAACEAWRPDVVAMDVAMPGTDGLAATRAIMARCPTPVVIVSSTLSDRHCQLAMEAFRAGAVDVALKPDLTDRAAGMRTVRHLVATLRMMSTVRLMRRSPADEAPTARARQRPVSLIGVGASTGGPEALRRLLRLLPADFPVPVLVVQHMLAEFLPGLAEWLDTCIPLPVHMARPGPLPASGGVLIAPGNQHVLVTDGRLSALPPQPGEAYCPGVDTLFASMAGMGPLAAGVLLTGMGADGAAGLLALKQAGAVTMAQDEDSSVVWGMPGVAVAKGAAAIVGPPETLAAHVLSLSART